MKAPRILADRHHKKITSARARLSETEARARHWKDTHYACAEASAQEQRYAKRAPVSAYIIDHLIVITRYMKGGLVQNQLP